MRCPFSFLGLVIFAIVACTDFQEEEVPVSFGVDVSQVDFSSAASTRSVTVSSGTKWDVSSMPQWISLQSINHSGYSPYEWTVSFSAAANDEYNREGTIIIKTGSNTAEISVSQEGRKGKYIAVESVSLSSMELTLTEGENASLVFTINPSNASIKDVTWESSSTSVATVSQSGRVDAVSEGTTLITVTTEDGNKTASCAVTVKAKVIPVTGISLNKTTLSMNEGDVQVLTATVSPSNATDKSVTWSSSNTSVATVSSSGVVTAKIAGSATIMVTTNDGGKTATCSVTVKSAWTVDGSENGHDYVDLGLPSGLKWATCNVGASSPEEYGNYYAWGETSTKSDYNWTNYKFRTSGDSNANVEFSKYNTHSGLGTVDNKIALDLSDDAARANWGGSWRMPTISEFQELIANCTYMWTTQNGVNGYKVTGKNGRSLFFPAAGSRGGTSLDNAGSYGGYWSSSLCTEGPTLARDLYFRSSDFSTGDYYRCNGRSVRPVFADGAVVHVIGVSLENTILSMTEGDTYTLIATVSPADATDKSVTWSSSNTSVATVSSSGVVTAKAAGSATITVTTNDGGKKAECQVLVKEPTRATSIAFTGTDFLYSARVGNQFTISVAIKPEDAYVELEWSVSDDTLAEITGEGSSITLHAKDYGPSTLRVRDKISGLSVSEQMSAGLTDFYWTENTGQTHNGCSLVEIEIGEEHQLQCHYTPEYATRVFRADMDGFLYYEPMDLGYGSVSEEPIHQVSRPSFFSIDENGKITGIEEGLAKIEVYSPTILNNAQDLYVRVKQNHIPVTEVSLDKTSLSMVVGDTQTLNATVTPSNATDKTVNWSSSNTSVATVSSSGVVTAKAAGNATITAKAGDQWAICTIIVKRSTSDGENEDVGFEDWK